MRFRLLLAALAAAPSATSTADDDDGWNIAGNPFAASMDWDVAGWTKTNIDATFYVWNPVAADCLSWNGTAGSLGDGVVAPAQGFRVHATGAPTLTAPAAAPTMGAPFVGRSAPGCAAIEVVLSDASRATLRASAHAPFQKGATDGRDRFDGYELSPIAATSRGLFTTRLSDGLPLDIQALAPTAGSVEIPLGVTAVTDGAPADADLVRTWPRLDGYDGPVLLTDSVDEGRARPSVGAEPRLPRRGSGDDVAAGVAQRERPGAARRSGGALHARARAAPGRGRGHGRAPRDNPRRGGSEPASRAEEVRYALAEAGSVTRTVHDLLGREAARLADGEPAAGSHTVRLEARDLAAGVHVVRMTAPGGFSAVRRVTVVR